MPTRPLLFALALALTLTFATAADADPILINANLTYVVGTGWSFDTGAVNGRIFIDLPTSRKLKKLDQVSVHYCSITYDPESKIEAANGDFYTLLRISKCN